MTLVIGSSLPIRIGSPQQRTAFALKQALNSRGDKSTHLTVDLWGTEWSSRALMMAGDKLVVPAESPARSFWRFPRTSSLNGGEGLGPDDEVLDARTRKKIIAFIQHHQPRDILLTEVAFLADLAPALSRLGADVHVMADETARWSAATANYAGDSDASRWHAGLAAKLRRADDLHAVLYGHSEFGDELRGRLDPWIGFERDSIIFSKTNSLVIPATGYARLDHALIEMARELIQLLASGSQPAADVVLIGFDGRHAEIEGAVSYPGWERLHTVVGAARYLFVPYLTPALANLVQNALEVGTQALTSTRYASLYRMADDWAGLIHGPMTGLVPLLAHVVTFEAPSEEMAGQIAQSAYGRRKRPNPGDVQGSTTAAASPPNIPVVETRLSPIWKRPTILYTGATGLLLLNISLNSAARIEEVRILNAAGRELMRLIPPNNRKTAVVNVEGGVVAALSEIGDFIKVELHDAVGFVSSDTIPVSEFKHIACGVAMAHAESPLLRGTVWLSEDVLDRQWSMEVRGSRYRLPIKGMIKMPEVRSVAIPFAIPLPPGGHLASVELLCADPASPYPKPEAPAQSAFRVATNAVRHSSRAYPELAALKGRHVGKRGWIIGNGPSVRLDDLERIPKGDVVFCFNRFYLSYGDCSLREDYVVSADTLMIRDFGQEMIDISTGLPLFCTSPAGTTHLSGKFVELIPGGHSVPLFSLDPLEYVNIGGSSVYVALQTAHYMGIRDIVLYGLDYSFTFNLRRDPRFPFPVSFEDGNHFIKSYRGAKPWCPPTWRDIAAGFLNARIAFEASGGRIVNATRGGKLETFPRVDFDQVCSAGLTRRGIKADSYPDKEFARQRRATA